MNLRWYFSWLFSTVWCMLHVNEKYFASLSQLWNDHFWKKKSFEKCDIMSVNLEKPLNTLRSKKAYGLKISHYYIGKWTEPALQRFIRKRCSENMLQIYRRTPIPKCDFNILFFYKHMGKLGLSSICLRFSQFEPEIMLDGMLNFKTLFMVWYCVWCEHCNGLF